MFSVLQQDLELVWEGMLSGGHRSGHGYASLVVSATVRGRGERSGWAGSGTGMEMIGGVIVELEGLKSSE